MSDRAKILVVDDDPYILLITSRVLESGGYEVVEASTGKGALEAVTKGHPDLILLDVILPDMNGLDVCKQIKADPALRGTFVVLQSGVSTSSEAQAHGLAIGADGYIVKGMPNKELLARVQSLVRIKQTEDALQRARDELEQRVKERTAELTAANQRLVASEKELVERLRFEALISDLSARFVNLTPDEIDSEINTGLRSITEFFDTDRCTIGVFSADGTQLIRVFEYHSAGTEPSVESISEVQLPWYVEQLRQGNPVVMNSVEDLPPEAEKERRLCLETGMKSVLSAPLVSGGKTLASCALVSTRVERIWPQALVQRFRALGQVFANALARRRAEEAIRKSEAKYRRLHESMMDGFVLVGMDGMIREYNESYRQVTGYAPEELSKLTYRDLTPEKWHDLEQKVIEHQVLTRGYSDVYEKEYRKKDGTIFPVELRTFLLKDETGSNSGMWAIVRDITERKRAEDEAHEARRDLTRMERLSRMGELTASLSHELSQPLAAILTSAQAAVRFLQSDTPDLNLFRTILENIIQDDKRAAGVITSLRSMMKREERAREPLNMNTVLDDVLNLFHSEAIVRNVTIERDFDLSLPPILGDRNQLQQVVLNLVMNAAEAMSESLREHEKRKIILRTRAANHSVQVAVRDFGPGIDPGKLADIWQPFFTTKKTGLGMGLGVSRSIIQAHGGRISAENNPDRGATFYFELPVAMNSNQ